MLRLPDPCLVVLVGAAGTGKSPWAQRWFSPAAIVSTEAIRAVVGVDEHDQRASKDAFDIVERIVEARLRRGFTTVVDSTALEPKQRAGRRRRGRARSLPHRAPPTGGPTATASTPGAIRAT